jgi:thiamine pyrophosphate-dependent acetolactate synthase large subunit-like protein
MPNADSIPMLIITGKVPLALIGSATFQEIDILV